MKSSQPYSMLQVAGLLYVENLKGAQGEIALKIGADNEPFGVINVGDDAKLVKLCAENRYRNRRARVLRLAVSWNQ
jgi:hypothetical protein